MTRMGYLESLGTILSGFSTVAIALLTLFLWRENRILRKAGSAPQLIAYYDPHPDGTGGLNITIANVGKGPAREVYFQFRGDSDNFSRYNLLLDCSSRRGPIATIPQDGKISIFFAVGHQLFNPKKLKGNEEKKPIEPFHICLEWKQPNGRKTYSEEFLLDVKPYSDLPGFVSKPHSLKLVDSVDRVGKQIGSLKPEVMKLINLIDANTLDCGYSKKEKGNSENV